MRANGCAQREQGSVKGALDTLSWLAPKSEVRGSWDARVILLVCRRVLKRGRTACIAAMLDSAWSQAKTVITF
jgi:hypothetical protein